MSRPGRWLMGALGGAVLLFAVGPRPRVRFDGAAPVVPADPSAVDAYLAEREGAVEGLRPNNEARVVWAGDKGARTKIALVAVHGFSASRGETAPLAENLARHYSANLFEARLTGHGATGAALGRATAEDWIRDTREALRIGKALGDQVVVVAASTGATLATLVAAEDQPDVSAYVFLSPNYGLKSAASSLLLWPWAKHWVPLVMGAERSWEPDKPEVAQYWTTRYPVDVLFPMMALVERSQTADLGRIVPPVLVLHSEEDHTVDPAAVEATFRRLTRSDPRRRRVVTGEGDTHVIAGAIMAPERTAAVEQEVKDFLQAIALSP